jgi:hypothetical protein
MRHALRRAARCLPAAVAGVFVAAPPGNVSGLCRPRATFSRFRLDANGDHRLNGETPRTLEGA